MNQYRWTCLTTLVFTTVLAPIATVHAKTLTAPALGSRDNQVPLSSPSLPIVTPLTVTELQTDVAVPAVTRVVPSVSQLPVVKPAPSAIVKPIAVANRTVAEGSEFSLQQKFPTAQSYPAQISATKFVPTNISFNPHLKAIDSSVTADEDRVVGSLPQLEEARVAKVQLLAPAPQPQTFTSFTTHKIATPIAVVRQDGTQSEPIVNSASAQAEIVNLPQPVPSVTPLNSGVATATYRPEIVPLPQPAPIVTVVEDRAQLPSFEAGAPVFIFDNERPQQIVTTTIAQIGDTTVAAEPSIAIPVQRPNQSTLPTQSALPDRSSAQPETTGIVTIDIPTETLQPALEKIVATHTGKASWYGSEGGARTANGERYNPNGLTAAHRTLPFGTKVRVTSLKTGKSTIVRINDRGPSLRSRSIDLSAGAAAIIGIKNDGIGDVKMEVLADEG